LQTIIALCLDWSLECVVEVRYSVHRDVRWAGRSLVHRRRSDSAFPVCLELVGRVQLAPEHGRRLLGDAGLAHHLTDVGVVLKEAQEGLGVRPFVDDQDFTTCLVGSVPSVTAYVVPSA